jgi:DNA repair exonuclease SbcCD nuclease subunit
MTKGRNLLLFLLLLNVICQAQTDSIQSRIILIGDAGALNKDTTHPVINAVRKTTKIDNKTTILYLGDNLYHTGLPDEQHLTYNISRAVLDTQARIAEGTGAKVYFIPGNHDWNRGHSGGWDAIKREQAYIDGLGLKNVKFYPKTGAQDLLK